MPEPDLTEDAPPLVEQALDAVDDMNPEDWVASTLAHEVERLRGWQDRAQGALEEMDQQRARDKARLAELLKAVGADPLRDWDDLLNAVVGIESERRSRRMQMDNARWLANQATPVLLSDPPDCTDACYRGSVCDCSGEKGMLAWNLDPASVLRTLKENFNGEVRAWDSLLNTVLVLKAELDATRQQIQEQNSALAKLFGLATPDRVEDVMAKVYATLALDDTPTTVKRKDLRAIVDEALREYDRQRADDGILPDAMAREMLRRKGFKVNEEQEWD